MMAKICVSCGKEISFCDGKVKVKDNAHVCYLCWLEAGFNTWGDLRDKPSMYSSKEIIGLIESRKAREAQIKNFVVASDVCPSAKFNDDTQQMILSDSIVVYYATDPQVSHPERYTLFSYDQISSFELLENGESVASGGVGRAIVGGLLFGGVGAIVGASTSGHKSVCEELKIKVTVNNYYTPAFYIPFIKAETKKSSSEYKEKMKMAQSTLSKLQLITTGTSHETSTAPDKFDEIRKYKLLLDDGIISQAEFETKKKQLLDL